jgi:hypothetical protein
VEFQRLLLALEMHPADFFMQIFYNKGIKNNKTDTKIYKILTNYVQKDNIKIS